MASGSMAMLRRAAKDCLCQASAENFQQCAEFLPLRKHEVEEAGRRLWARHLEVEKSSSDARSLRRPHARRVSTSLREASIKLLPAAAQHRARSKSGKPNGVSSAVTNSWVFLTAPWRREAGRAGRLLPSHRWAAPMHQRAVQAASRPPSPAACPAAPPRACRPSLAYRDR